MAVTPAEGYLVLRANMTRIGSLACNPRFLVPATFTVELVSGKSQVDHRVRPLAAELAAVRAGMPTDRGRIAHPTP